MHLLDRSSVYKRYDPSEVGFCIDRLAEQVRSAWHDAHEVRVSRMFARVRSIVAVGSQHSLPGILLAQTTFHIKGKIPFFAHADYMLPSFVDAQTLVLVCDSSGSSDEVLSAAEDARKRHAKIVVFSSGGALVDWAHRHQIPCFVLVPGDFAHALRFGIGFIFGGILGFLHYLELFSCKEEDVQRILAAMGEVTDLCAHDIPFLENPAKQVAHALLEKQVLFFAAEHLVGTAEVFAHGFREIAKHFACVFALPYAHQHILSASTYPKVFSQKSAALFLHSELYHPKTRKCFTTTADALEERGIEVVDYVARGKDAYEEVGELFQFSRYVSWYLALLHKENPAENCENL